MIVHKLKSEPIPWNMNPGPEESPFHPTHFQTDMDGNKLSFRMVSPQDQFLSEVFVVREFGFVITREKWTKWT